MLSKIILKRLLINLVLAFLLGSLLMVVSTSLFHKDKTGSTEGNSGLIDIILTGVVWNFVLTISSLTVLLNLDKRIRQNKFLSSLTFLFLPVLVSIFVFNLDDHDFKDLWQPFLTMTLPFLLTQTYFCFKFLDYKL